MQVLILPAMWGVESEQPSIKRKIFSIVSCQKVFWNKINLGKIIKIQPWMILYSNAAPEMLREHATVSEDDALQSVFNMFRILNLGSLSLSFAIHTCCYHTHWYPFGASAANTDQLKCRNCDFIVFTNINPWHIKCSLVSDTYSYRTVWHPGDDYVCEDIQPK